MILGDLIDARVLGPDGDRLGHVIDVRLSVETRQEADTASSDDPSTSVLAGQERRSDAVGRLDLVGLLVSPRTGSSFLGYERGAMRSPWLIATLLRRRHRGTFLVAWEEVAALADGTVTLRAGYRREDPRIDDDAR